MKNKLILMLIITSTVFMSGCDGHFSPRQELDNKGKIEELENLSNSLKNEIANLRQENKINDSQLEKLQQGIANLQTNNENSGIQILSGPGGIVVAIVGLTSLVVLGVVSNYYRTLALKNEKMANIMAERIVEIDNPFLEDKLFQAAMYTEVEEEVLNLIKKHKGQGTS